MAIIKSKHASNYTVIPNEVFKLGLSLEAIGLLSYLLSLPHDWVIYKTNLHEQLNIGKDKLSTAFKSLQDSGYILSVKKHGENGKIEYEHIVYDKPYNGEPHTAQPHTAQPCTEKPCTVKPLTVNPPLQSTNKQNTNKQSKQINKIKNIKEITLSDVINYFKDNGYTESSATMFYNYYSASDWIDSKGNKVKNWKQKAIGVWFKPENKIQEVKKTFTKELK